MNELKYRLGVIAALVFASILALWPRDTVERVTLPDQTVRLDTVKRIPIKQGLDLRGGMFIALEIDESKGVVTDKAEGINRALVVVRSRIDQFGVAEPNVQKAGNDRINVELPGIDDPQRAQDIVQKSAFLEFQIVDKSRELERAIPRMDQILKQKGVVAATQGSSGGDNPVTKLLIDSAKAAGDSNAVAPDSLGALQSRIGTGTLPNGGEYMVATTDYLTVDTWLRIPEVKAVLRPGKEILWGSDTVPQGNKYYRALYVLDTRTILEGKDLIDAQPQQDPMEGVMVNFRINNVGARRFYQQTSAHIGDNMAIVLDDRVMGQPPTIQSAIRNEGRITMPGKPLSEAQDLALVLRAGALPVPLKILEVRQIGASMGQDAINQGLRAGALGIILVIAIMLVYYRFSGLLAVLGLMFYSITTLAVLTSLDAVLTLPGLAGFVLSIGMAVDANFLIFERIREELARGKTVRTAINEGFDHAWSAIVDTHVTTALTALILYQFGTGPVRGFAVTLLAGLASSMVSAIFVVRSLFLLWLSRSRKAEALSI